jgi:hypothetical protein
MELGDYNKVEIMHTNTLNKELRECFEELNEPPRSRAAKYQKEFSFNPDAEHRGILLINLTLTLYSCNNFNTNLLISQKRL